MRYSRRTARAIAHLGSERSATGKRSVMATHEQLLDRIRGEYVEMPGLRLTFPQACRLWHVDPQTCQTVLRDLVAERFLHQAQDGAYCAFPTTRATTAKATLAS